MNDRSRLQLSSKLFAIGTRAASWCSPVAAALPAAAKALAVVAAGGLLVAFSTSPTLCKVACKPIITVKSVKLSEPEGLQRLWSAVLNVDAGRCANASGRFDIDFVRGKEMSADLQFTESFRWKPGETEATLEIWIDEAIQDFRIGFIAPCMCREPPF